MPPPDSPPVPPQGRQLRFPRYPEGTIHVSDSVSAVKRDGTVWYFQNLDLRQKWVDTVRFRPGHWAWKPEDSETTPNGTGSIWDSTEPGQLQQEHLDDTIAVNTNASKSS
jgi:hypothetical protein